MNFKKPLTIFLFLVFIVSNIVYGQPPFTQESKGDLGFDIIVPLTKPLKLREVGVTIHSHVYNRSTGRLLNNETVDCYLHLYDPKGNHIHRAEMGFEIDDNSGGEFELSLSQNNFTFLGENDLLIQCNNSLNGGFIFEGIIISEDGEDPNAIKDPYNLYIFFGYIILILVLIMFMHKFKEDRTTVVYGIIGATVSFIMGAMLLQGLIIIKGFTFFIDINYYIALLVIGIGIYCTVIFLTFKQDLKEESD